MVKKYLLTATLTFSALSWADDCPTRITALLAERDFKAALTLFNDDDFCYENLTMAENAKTEIFQQWGNDLLAKVLQGEKATFGKKQMARLEKESSTLEWLSHNARGMTSSKWQLELLELLLKIDHNHFNTFENYERLAQVCKAYETAEAENNLPAVFRDAGIGKFIVDYGQFLKQKLPEEELEKIETLGTSGNDCTGNLMINYIDRAPQMASSEQQPLAMTAPIRFLYDSVELSEVGKREYRNQLRVLKSGSVNHIFLIGHADPKGADDYNCWLSQCRVKALAQKLQRDGVNATIKTAWAGENIPFDGGNANKYLDYKKMNITKKIDNGDESRRRVEYEVNGEFLRQKYRGQFCQLTDKFKRRPCP